MTGSIDTFSRIDVLLFHIAGLGIVRRGEVVVGRGGQITNVGAGIVNQPDSLNIECVGVIDNGSEIAALVGVYHFVAGIVPDGSSVPIQTSGSKGEASIIVGGDRRGDNGDLGSVAGEEFATHSVVDIIAVGSRSINPCEHAERCIVRSVHVDSSREGVGEKSTRGKTTDGVAANGSCTAVKAIVHHERGCVLITIVVEVDRDGLGGVKVTTFCHLEIVNHQVDGGSVDDMQTDLRTQTVAPVVEITDKIRLRFTEMHGSCVGGHLPEGGGSGWRSIGGIGGPGNATGTSRGGVDRGRHLACTLSQIDGRALPYGGGHLLVAPSDGLLGSSGDN